MNNTPEAIGSLLSQVLSKSEYTYFLARHAPQIGVRVNQVTFLLHLDARSGEATLRLCEDPSHANPYYWVECDASVLAEAANGSKSVSELVIRTGPRGQVLHPRVEQLALRCLQPPPYPLDDREELIYPALFGFNPPRVVWESKQALLRVLQYSGNGSGDSFCVSCGLSEPWAWEPAEIYDGGVSGAGYELVIKASEPAIVTEFTDWVRYVERSMAHLLPGNWLEFEGGKLIPGTNVAGFLVTRPTSFLPYFPVGSSVAHWHSLVPVSTTQLDLAKRTDVFQAAETVEGKLSC